LTGALSAFGEAYKDYVISAGFDPLPDNVRLSVRELKSGSIIADMIAVAHQASFIHEHKGTITNFASHLNDILQWFLLPGGMGESATPTKKEAAQAISIMEPVAKDRASQLNITAARDAHTHIYHYYYESQQANAIQNNASRHLGPDLRTSRIYQDQILALYQVRGDPAAKVGDKGIIEEISPLPAKLLFASEEVKNQAVGQPYPFQKLFLVDVEAKSAEGKVRLYRVFNVKDVLDKD
jgi:hypothetical protein